MLEAVRKIGYVPNAIAGSLSSSRSNIVAAIVPTITNPVFADTIHAMAEVLREHGYHLLLGQSGASPAEERSLIETFLAHRPDALFIHGGLHSPEVRALLAKAGIPIVEAGNLRKQPLDMVVSYSNFAAAEAMTEHLIARGRRRIGFVSSQRRDNDRAQARRRGFGAALQAPRPAGRRAPGAGDHARPAPGRRGARRARRARPELDAVFFAGDVLAAGALFECRRRGWAVPQRAGDRRLRRSGNRHRDRSHHGAVPRAEIGRRAAEMLLARLDGKPVEPRRGRRRLRAQDPGEHLAGHVAGHFFVAAIALNRLST